MDRRQFIATTATGFALGLAGNFASSGRAATPMKNANSRLRVAVVGTNSRGLLHIQCFASLQNVEVAYICDVDERAVAKGIREAAKWQKAVPKGIRDFREALEDPDIDAISIATPDHWHAPMSILALAAGKHVYVEKPCSHNPHEGELLIAAIKRYGGIVQMGNQRRSFSQMKEAIQAIHQGAIGRAYFGRAWYTNNRGPLGPVKPAAIPAWLDYDLWQGPAPRRPFVSNLIHYNWHWFWHWGTGEALNNGTHEVDVCRWALGVDNPIRVTASGGRYHFKDDWETPDTQVMNWDFPEDKSISWESRSCNPFPEEGHSRGAMIYGTDGAALLDGTSYVIYDQKGKVVREVKDAKPVDSTDTLSSTGVSADTTHFQNFADAIRNGIALNSPIEEVSPSVTMLHLGNISWRVRRELHCDPTNAHILEDPRAMDFWRREYAPGWKPIV